MRLDFGVQGAPVQSPGPARLGRMRCKRRTQQGLLRDDNTPPNHARRPLPAAQRTRHVVGGDGQRGVVAQQADHIQVGQACTARWTMQLFVSGMEGQAG